MRFQNLPDVDFTQQEVFETDDLQLASGTTRLVQLVDDYKPNTEQEQDEAIINEHLSTKAAQKRFKDAVLDSLGVDFSERLLNKRRVMYKEAVRYDSDSIEVLSSNGAKLQETPSQMLRRLVFEVQELEQRLKQEPVESPMSAASLLEHVGTLSEQLQQYGLSTNSILEQNKPIQTSLNFQPVIMDPEQIKLQVSDKKQSELIKRVTQLEQSMGNLNLGKSIEQLQRQVSLLAQPGALDGMSAKVHQLIADMNHLGTAPQNLQQLYEIAESCQSHLDQLPAVLARVQSMKPLVIAASQFNQAIAELSQQQDDLQQLLEHCRQLLSK